MLLNLPEDLLLALLSEWLPDSLLDLSHLDVACCNRASRSCWLEVIRRVRIEEADAAKPMANFLTWLHNRSVFMIKLKVSMGEESWESLSGLTLSLRTTSLECSRNLYSEPNKFSQPIQTLVSFFPCLTALDWDCFNLSGDVFPKLSSCCPPLRKLCLHCCRAVNMSNVAALLAAISLTLEELQCDHMDEQMVLTLAENCRTLRRLSCNFHPHVKPTSIVSLCSNSPELISVEFHCKLANNKLILSILVACPSIRDVVLGCLCKINQSELLYSQAVLALDSISMRSIFYRIFPCESSPNKRCCEIVVTAHDNMELLRMFSSLFIRGITFSERDGMVVNAEMSRVLADAHGHSLEKCEMYLWQDIEQADVQYFLDLSLTRFGKERTLIDDADMRNLPLWCPRIAKLELIDCAIDITDESIIYALQTWSANGITVVNLQGCQLLTDAVLQFIGRCCPQLTSLSVQREVAFKSDTNFSKWLYCRM